MDNEQIRCVSVGIFPSDAGIERAIRALQESGIEAEQIALYMPARSNADDIFSSPDFQPFTDEQLRRYAQDVESGRSLLTVLVYGDPEDVNAILTSHGALRADTGAFTAFTPEGRTLPIYEEQLRVNKEMQEIGEVVIRKVVEDVPTQAEVDAIHEELDVEHVSVGEVVEERREPWREGNVLVVPVYEEQMVVVRQLVMREQLRISMRQVTEKHHLSETLKREYAVVEDPDQTGRVHVNQPGAESPIEDDEGAERHPGE